MIAVVPSELREKSRMPSMQNLQECSFLEQLTGADFLISPVELPLPNEQLLRMHIEQGAILVQRKSGRDFVESCYHRAKVALARMQAFGAEKRQCWILATGVFLPSANNGMTAIGDPSIADNGNISFRWNGSDINYSTFATAKRRLLMRGANVEFLSCDDEIPGWCLGMEKDLKFMKNNPTKEVYPESSKFHSLKSEPFQELKLIEDQRSVLAAFRGVGPKKATALWETLYEWNRHQMPLDRGWVKEDWEPKLVQMLHWASISEKERKQLALPKISLWGEKTRQEVATQLGLEEGEYLTTRKDLL